MEISKVQQGFLVGVGLGVLWGMLIYQLILNYKEGRTAQCTTSPAPAVEAKWNPPAVTPISPKLPVPNVEPISRIPTVSIGRNRNYKEMLVEATAYTAGAESTGKSPGHPGYGLTKSGYRADLGAIAVDPKIIPLGSVVWVEGYGYAVALDIGGAIKGEKIDVFFHEVSKALAWGRRKVRIRILGGVIDEYR